MEALYRRLETRHRKGPSAFGIIMMQREFDALIEEMKPILLPSVPPIEFVPPHVGTWRGMNLYVWEQLAGETTISMLKRLRMGEILPVGDLGPVVNGIAAGT